jgi:carbon-monoxide dehydrogenase large subunit
MSAFDSSSVEMRPKMVGQRIKRTEDPRLLAGVGRYVDDITPQGALHIAIRRSDQPHARICSIDVGEAFAVPGVVAIFDATDLEGDLKPAVPTSKMKNYYATPIWPLARGKVRYVGEPVVAVVAESRYAAEDALEHISIDYEPLPFAIRQTDADDSLAPVDQSHDGTQGCGPAAAVAPEQRNHFSALQRERHAVQDVGLPIPGIKILHRERVCSVACCCCHCLRSTARDREPR